MRAGGTPGHRLGLGGHACPDGAPPHAGRLRPRSRSSPLRTYLACGHTPWEARSITPWLTRCVECAPDQGGPRPPVCTLWHETERALPIAVYERALSVSELFQPTEAMAAQ